MTMRQEQMLDEQGREIERLDAENRKLKAALAAARQEGRAEGQKEMDRLRAGLQSAISGATCHSLHHDKADRHEWDEPCPVYARLKALAAGVPPEEKR